MSVAVFIKPQDRLGPLYSKMHIPFGDGVATSIEMAFWASLLHLHGEHELLDQLVQHSGLKRAAVGIRTWIQSKPFQVDSYWEFNLDIIYYTIVGYLAREGNNQVSSEFARIDQEYPGAEVKFVLTSKRRDFVWSCGLRHRSNKLIEYDNYGLNVYGIILGKVFKELRDGKESRGFKWCELLERTDKIGTRPSATVLLISDSECRQVASISGGDVVKIGGAKYHNLAHAIWEKGLTLTRYNYIIIHCGVNHCRHNDPQNWRRSWRQLESALAPVVFHGSPHRIILNSPIRNPKAPFVKEHTEWIKGAIEHIPNLTFCDWSGRNNNPFVRGGRANETLYTSDRFHINHMGFRELWLKWTDEHAELITVSYEMSHAAYQ